MLLMRENPLRGHMGGGFWALEIETFLGPVKRHRAVRRVPFGAQTRCFLRWALRRHAKTNEVFE